MGGAIAQEIALQAPGRVRTLTLAVTFSTGGTYSRKLAEVWGARVRQISREQHVDELMLMNHSEEFFENPDMVEFVRTAMLQNPHPQPPEAFGRQLAACSRHDTRDRLGTLTMPTHVIGAERDILVPVWKSQEIAAAIPGAKLNVLPAAPARPVARARRGVQRGRARLHPRDGSGAGGVGRRRRAAAA